MLLAVLWESGVEEHLNLWRGEPRAIMKRGRERFRQHQLDEATWADQGFDDPLVVRVTTPTNAPSVRCATRHLPASLTSFGVLALFPLLLFLVTLTGLVLRFEQIELILEVGRVAPADATRIIAQQIRDIHQGQDVGLLTVGLIGAICHGCPQLRRAR